MLWSKNRAHRRGDLADTWDVQLPVSSLLTNTQSQDEPRVLLGILSFQVIEQASALSDELQQATPRMVILRVRLEVFSQIANPFAEEGNLNFG